MILVLIKYPIIFPAIAIIKYTDKSYNIIVLLLRRQQEQFALYCCITNDFLLSTTKKNLILRKQESIRVETALFAHNFNSGKPSIYASHTT